MFENTSTAQSAGPMFHQIDGPALRRLITALMDGFTQLRTPYRPSIEGRIMRATPGPRAPISAAILDLEHEVSVSLSYSVPEVADSLDLTPPEADPVTQMQWLIAHANDAATQLEAGEVMDLEVLEDRCRRMAGLPDPAMEEEARRAALATGAGLTPAVWASAEKIARLAAQTTGVPISHSTVRKWGAAGLVESRETGCRPAVEYRLDSVIEAQMNRDNEEEEVVA